MTIMQDIHIGDSGRHPVHVRLHRHRVPRRRALAHRRPVPHGLQGHDVQRPAGRRGRQLAGRQQADDGRGEGGHRRPRRADRHPAAARDEVGRARRLRVCATRSRRPSRRRASGWPRATSCSSGPGTRASGWTKGPGRPPTRRPGFHTTAMPLFHERDVAAIGYDGDGETVPSHCEGVTYPIHAIGMSSMGLYFLDSLSASRTWPRRARRRAGGSSSASSRRCGSRRAPARP